MKKLLILTTLFTFATAQVSNKEIANMFILGFYGNSANSGTKINNDICNLGLGGVILFQKLGKRVKNFSNASDLKALTTNLKSCGTKPLIAIDQEGGVVQRLKLKYKYPKASVVATKGIKYANNIYKLMAKELQSVGVNLNFAPVADIAINPNNKVIVKWGRSYGANENSVINYCSTFIDAMHSKNIATSLKHFPGHGSSLGDTHKGFVDVTKLWQQRELAPYKALKNKTDTIMVAHIFNRNLDANYPASLSKKIVTGILRNKIGYSGVVVTDDMQMGALSKHYSLRDRIKLAINAGDDILLFANQINKNSSVTTSQVVKIVRSLLNSGEVSEQSIKNANIRINSLKNRLY